MWDIWLAISGVYNGFVLVYFFLIDLVYLSLLLIALRAILVYLRKNRFVNYERILQSEFAVPISILAPAYNEEKTITESIQSLMMLNYAKYEVIVINDGSKDSTLQQLIDSFKLKKITPVFETLIRTEPVSAIYRSPLPAYKRLVVVDKKKRRKGGCAQCGYQRREISSGMLHRCRFIA